MCLPRSGATCDRQSEKWSDAEPHEDAVLCTVSQDTLGAGREQRLFAMAARGTDVAVQEHGSMRLSAIVFDVRGKLLVRLTFEA